MSHARSFLNHVCTDILHFANKGIKRYKGDYDIFEVIGAWVVSGSGVRERPSSLEASVTSVTSVTPSSLEASLRGLTPEVAPRGVRYIRCN